MFVVGRIDGGGGGAVYSLGFALAHSLSHTSSVEKNVGFSEVRLALVLSLQGHHVP